MDARCFGRKYFTGSEAMGCAPLTIQTNPFVSPFPHGKERKNSFSLVVLQWYCGDLNWLSTFQKCTDHDTCCFTVGPKILEHLIWNEEELTEVKFSLLRGLLLLSCLNLVSFNYSWWKIFQKHNMCLSMILSSYSYTVIKYNGIIRLPLWAVLYSPFLPGHQLHISALSFDRSLLST